MNMNNKITPIGLKGQEINERMKELMGIKTINEDKKTSVVELTKLGPDGNIYGVIRENHEYYIKTVSSDKKNNLIAEDFNYIGGLQNKKSEAYPSYAKAIKKLNLKFLSINDANGMRGQINIFENDKLSATKGIGDADEFVTDEKGTELSCKAKEGTAEGEFGDNLANGKVKNDIEKVKLSENGFAGGFADMPKGGGFSGAGNLEGNKPMYEEETEEADELTEIEKAVDELKDKDDKKEEEVIKETHKLSISRALKQMDSIIESLSEGDIKKKSIR